MDNSMEIGDEFLDILYKDIKNCNSIKRNFKIFSITNKYYIFESNTRIVYSITKNIYDFLSLYFQDDFNYKVLNDYFNSHELKKIYNYYNSFEKLRVISQKQEFKIQKALGKNEEIEYHTGETIISFLGKRQCNLGCKYCFIDNDSTCKNDEELTEEMMRKGFDFILGKKKNTYRVRADYSLGGEPLLSIDTYKKLWAISKEYDALSDIEVALGFITNATLLNDEVIDWFDKNHHWMGFSLDGGRETHNTMRVFKDGRGTFDIAMSNIQKVLDLNWEYFPGVNAVLTGKNPNILKIFNELWDLGFRIITIKLVRASSQVDYAITMKNIEIIKAGYLEFCEFLINKTINGELEYLKSIINPFDFFGRFLMRIFKRDRIVLKRCAGASKIFSMRNNGDLYPCDSFNGIDMYKLGNVSEGNINTEIFKAPNVLEVDKCRDCWNRYVCGGVCMYTQHLNQGKEDSASLAECEIEKYLVMLSCHLWSEVKHSASSETIDDLNDYINIMTGGATW